MKKLFKATSQIRDIDIIEAKMRQFDSAPALPEFLARQTDKRKQLLVTEAKAAKTLKQTAVPRFKTRQISDTKLSKRTKKVTKRLENRFKGHLSIALNKPTPDQLHDFRKTCKMLRYTFEIEKEANERVLGPLQELQKLLGGILDNYTTLRSISESSFKNSAALILDKLNLETEEMRHSLRIILEKMEGSTVKKSGMVEISQARRMERDLSSNLGVAPTAKESRH
jgi:CHAD domain-containing protein